MDTSDGLISVNNGLVSISESITKLNELIALAKEQRLKVLEVKNLLSPRNMDDIIITKGHVFKTYAINSDIANKLKLLGSEILGIEKQIWDQVYWLIEQYKTLEFYLADRYDRLMKLKVAILGIEQRISRIKQELDTFYKNHGNTNDPAISQFYIFLNLFEQDKKDLEETCDKISRARKETAIHKLISLSGELTGIRSKPGTLKKVPDGRNLPHILISDFPLLREYDKEKDLKSDIDLLLKELNLYLSIIDGDKDRLGLEGLIETMLGLLQSENIEQEKTMMVELLAKVKSIQSNLAKTYRDINQYDIHLKDIIKILLDDLNEDFEVFVNPEIKRIPKDVAVKYDYTPSN